MAASLHATGLQNESLSLISQPALDLHDSLWVEDIVKCANLLDSYWQNNSTKRSAPLENGFTPPPRFENLTPVGHGGMGVVYSAVDKQTNEKVAIKVGRALEGHSDFIKREFRTLAEIRHPNLVVLKELHQFGDSVFFTMEYIHGDSFNSKPVAKTNDGLSLIHI